MDRWVPMNNPLELTGRVLGLSRPDTGRVLIVGGRRDRRRLAWCLGQGPWAGLPVVGFVDAGHPRHPGRRRRGRHLAVHPGADPVPVLGGVDRLEELVQSCRATHVVVAISGPPAGRLRPRMAHLGSPEVAVHWVGEEAGGDAGPGGDGAGAGAAAAAGAAGAGAGACWPRT